MGKELFFFFFGAIAACSVSIVSTLIHRLSLLKKKKKGKKEILIFIHIPQPFLLNTFISPKYQHLRLIVNKGLPTTPLYPKAKENNKGKSSPAK